MPVVDMVKSGAAGETDDDGDEADDDPIVLALAPAGVLADADVDIMLSDGGGPLRSFAISLRVYSCTTWQPVIGSGPDGTGRLARLRKGRGRQRIGSANKKASCECVTSRKCAVKSERGNLKSQQSRRTTKRGAVGLQNGEDRRDVVLQLLYTLGDALKLEDGHLAHKGTCTRETG